MRRGQIGGRLDWQASKTADVTVQGDAYTGRLGLLNAPDTSISGGNVVARWTRRNTWGITQAQVFYDRVARDVPDQFGERRNTFDIDVQQNVSHISGHSIVFGGGYRISDDDTDITRILFFEPKGRTTHLFNLFAQDEISLGRGVFGTLGSKLEHNSYSGWELQPTGRIRWTRGRDTLWGAVSRAVRMPTRFDSDIRVTGGLPAVLITGSPGFRSEKMIAYEAGFRSQPMQRLTYEAAVYYDRYDDLRSQDLVPNAPHHPGQFR